MERGRKRVGEREVDKWRERGEGKTGVSRERERAGRGIEGGEDGERREWGERRVPVHLKQGNHHT